MGNILSFSCISYFVIELIKAPNANVLALVIKRRIRNRGAVSLEATVTQTGVMTLVDSCAGGIDITERFVPAIKLSGHSSLVLQFI